MNENEERKREKIVSDELRKRKKKTRREKDSGGWTRSGSRSMSWESLSEKTSPRSSVTHCLGYRIRFSTGRTSLHRRPCIRLGWLVSLQRVQCVFSTHPRAHIYIIYTRVYKRIFAIANSRSFVLQKPIASLFGYVTKAREGFLPACFEIQSTIYELLASHFLSVRKKLPFFPVFRLVSCRPAWFRWNVTVEKF